MTTRPPSKPQKPHTIGAPWWFHAWMFGLLIVLMSLIPIASWIASNTAKAHLRKERAAFEREKGESGGMDIPSCVTELRGEGSWELKCRPIHVTKTEIGHSYTFNFSTDDYQHPILIGHAPTPKAEAEKPLAIEGQLQGNYTPLPGEHCSRRRFDGKCIQWSKDLPEAHALHAKPVAKPSAVECYQWVFDGLKTYCSEPAQPIPPHAPCTYGDGPDMIDAGAGRCPRIADERTCSPRRSVCRHCKQALDG